MQGKRGQVTIFIIVGVILMFSVALFLYFRSVSAPVTEEAVQAEYLPVQNYVQQCVETLARRAIILLGIQGGYLQLPEKIAKNPNSYLPIIPNGDIKLPYWYYQGESRVPGVKDMETDIGNYVSLNLLGCLQGFEPLLEQFTITPVGDITSLVTLGEEDVTVQTTYPLQTSLQGRDETVSFTAFTAHVPVRLKRMHRLATEIMRAENKGLLLENITVDLMALGPGDPPDGIPFSDMVFSCGMLKWRKPRVAESIKNRLFYNLPRITFANTRFDPPPDLYSANNLHLDVTDEDYSDLQAGVFYAKGWDFLMNVRPSRGDVMSADFGKGNAKYLSYICLNVYHFTYDLEYPVEITLRDEAAFGGDGYDFSFATPVMIKHNEGNRANVGFSAFEAPEGNDHGYCDQLREEETVIYAKDASTFEDLNGVNITFSCVDAYACPLGQTGPDGQVYRLRARLPLFCAPGSLVAEGEGYITTKEGIADTATATVALTSKRPFRFQVMKRALTDATFAAPQPLAEGEQALIYLTTESFPDFTQYKKFPEEDALDLAMGDVTYHLDLLLLDKDNDLVGGYRGNWTPDMRQAEGFEAITLYGLVKGPRPVGEEEQARLFGQLEDPALLQQIQPTFGVLP